MNIKNSFTTLALTGAFLTSAGVSLAAGGGQYGTSNCQVIYGGGEVCNNEIKFSINKMVGVPNTSNFTDNITVNDAKYTADATVPFKIIITNTGNTKIGHIKVTDTLPSYLTFVNGSGNWDANSRTLTFELNNLDAGRAQQFIINVKVVSDNQLPQDQGSVCVVNQVVALEDSGVKATDAAQVCITRQMIPNKPTPEVYNAVPVKKIPNTGPEMLPLLGLIPAGLTGIVLRKKARI